MDARELNFTYRKDSTNCPNCGAPIESEKCAYCGTMFVDFAAVDADEPFYMKIKHNGEVFVMKVKLESATLQSDTTDLYFDNLIYTSKRNPTRLSMEFVTVL